MNFSSKLLAGAFLFSLGFQAQTTSDRSGRTCGTAIPTVEWDNWFNEKVLEHKNKVASGKTQNTNYTIPVIVHVIHAGQNIGSAANISAAQINSQITVLNDDFAGNGLNVGNLASMGFGVPAADCSISFCLAQLDPQGNPLCEAGIERIHYNTLSGTNPATISTTSAFQNFIDGTVKVQTIWDPTRYFNIWVTDHHANVDLLGYATFPTGTGLTGISGSGGALNDGVWCWSKAFGNMGTALYPYHKGRTATHEIGHWLGLRHIWGDANCGNDFCNDTPTQKTSNYGCKTYPANTSQAASCAATTVGDMFMNFMDYSDDLCLYMFTADQSTRMTTAMTNGTYRNQLTASSATLCNVVSYSMPVPDFALASTACKDSVLNIIDNTSGNPCFNHLWTITPINSGGVITPSNSAVNPSVKFSNFGTYTVNLFASNSAGTATLSRVVVVTGCTDDVGIKAASALQKSLVLAPNPSTGVINIITSSAENKNLEIEVHNYLGQFVTAASFKDATTSSATLDLSGYTNGVYFITIGNGTEKTVKRVILNK